MTLTRLDMVEERKLASAKTCCECGRLGDELAGHYAYVGGQGEVMVYTCQDCLKSRDEGSRRACEALSRALGARQLTAR